MVCSKTGGALMCAVRRRQQESFSRQLRRRSLGPYRKRPTTVECYSVQDSPLRVTWALTIRKEKDTVSTRKNLLLTGPKHVGKSTVLDAALARVGGPIGGFRVDRVYEGRRLRAFRLVDVALGDSAQIASARKGGWDVNVAGFETVGAEAIRRAVQSAQLIVMDELGRFELGAPAFRNAVMEALSSPVPVVGVLKADANSFLDAIRSRDDTMILEVSETNRDEISLCLEGWLACVLRDG